MEAKGGSGLRLIVASNVLVAQSLGVFPILVDFLLSLIIARVISSHLKHVEDL